MEMTNPIFARRSVRQFSDRPVEEEKLQRLLQAAMQAPSAKNDQPWQFLLVRDGERKGGIADVQPYARPAASADVDIVLLADMSTQTPGRSAFWPQDMGACAQNILLQAAGEGLGAVWLGMYPDEDRVAKMRALFDLPEEIVPFCVIALGYPAKEPAPPESRFDPRRIHREHYGNRD